MFPALLLSVVLIGTPEFEAHYQRLTDELLLSYATGKTDHIVTSIDEAQEVLGLTPWLLEYCPHWSKAKANEIAKTLRYYGVQQEIHMLTSEQAEVLFSQTVDTIVAQIAVDAPTPAVEILKTIGERSRPHVRSRLERTASTCRLSNY